jgi:MFS family permease
MSQHHLPAHAPAPGSNAARPRVLLAALALAVFVLSLLQTLVVPVLSQIGQTLHASTTAVGWVSTSTLLAASVITPLAGRLGDVLGKRPVLLVALTITLAGSVLAATTSSLPLLIVGRALQGASFGIFPLAIGILREEYPARKLTPAMAIVSSTLGFGGGVALVATGLLTANGGDYHRIFWLSAAMSLLALVVATISLPKRTAPGGSVDYLGAAVLGTGLVLLLLPLSQGHIWGWTSAATLGCLLGSVLVLAGFLLLQRRTAVPLVAPALLAKRAIAVTNLAAMGVGFAMFCAFLGISYFVQMSTRLAGYGFSASVLAASAAYLLPGTLVSVLVAPIAGRFVVSAGPRLVLGVAGAAGAVGFTSLALAHGSSWQVVAAAIVVNSAIGAAYAAMPALIVMHVEPSTTGIANSVNSIARSVGSSIGSAIVVTVLSSKVSTLGLPTEAAFTLVFLLGAAGFAVVAVTVLFGLPTPRRALSVSEARDEVALADAGEFAGAGVSLGSADSDRDDVVGAAR